MGSKDINTIVAQKFQKAERKFGRKLTQEEIAAIYNPPKQKAGKGTSVEQTNLNPRAIAQKFQESAKNHWGAVDTQEFQDLLKTVNQDNVIAILKEYDKISPDESFIEMICDEKGNSSADRKSAISDVFNKLLLKAKEAGVDVAHFKNSFNTELNHQFDKIGFTSTEKLDEIINAVIQATENKQQLTSAEKAEIAKTPATKLYTTADKILATRINSAQKSFNNQLKQDGWAGDVADFVGKLYGSENTADNIRKDLKLAKNQFAQLEAAKKQGSEAYEAKFHEIFGKNFDAESIKVFENKEKIYSEASIHNGIEEYFKNQSDYFLNRKGLSDEYSTMPGTVPVTIKTATKEQVYDREVKKFANFLGEDGQKVLADALQNAGLENADVDKKFAFVQKMAKDIANQLHQNTLTAGGGKEFNQVQHEYEYSYKAAFGVKNDIMKRVTDYNISQQVGAGAVKAGVVIGASLAAAFTGGASLTAVAGITAGATVVTEITDNFTTGEVMDTLKADGFVAAIKKGNENTNYTEIFKQAVISGGMVLVGGGVAKGVQFASKGLTTVQQAAAMFGTDVVTGMAAEKLMTGEITVGGTVFNVLLSGAGNIVAVKMAAKAAQAGKASQAAAPKPEAAPAPQANKPAATLAEAGFTDDVIQELGKTLYGPKLVDEVLNMVNYLEEQVAAGRPITKKLIEGAINKFSPGASGGSAATQRAMIANNWRYGDEVYNAYGHLAPRQNAISKGGVKAAYNKTKAKVEDFVQKVKWDLGLDEPVSVKPAPKTKASTANRDDAIAQMRKQYPDMVERLANYKTPDGKPLFKQSEIDDILLNCSKTIEKNPAQIYAILDNPEEITSIMEWKNRGAGLWRAIGEPFDSTIKAHPEAFGVKQASPEFKAKFDAAKSTQDVEALVQNSTNPAEIDYVIQELKSKPIMINQHQIENILEDARTKSVSLKARPEKLMRPAQADNIANQGISFKQAPDQPVYKCTKIEWGKTVEETIALNKKNGINIELVKDADGNYFMGIKDIWSEGGYHRIDRNSAVMQYGKYPKTDQYVDQAWAAKNADADGNIMDCAVVANDKGAQILENSYVTESGQKIDFATMEPGTPVRKDPNATVNAVAYESPQKLTTLEGPITTDITMGDVDGNVYNNFKQLKKQITKGQLVPNEADPNSARFIELVKAGDDDAAIALLKQATQATAPKTSAESFVITSLADKSPQEILSTCTKYAEENGLKVKIAKNSWGNENIVFTSTDGKPVRELNFIGNELFSEEYITYDAYGNIKNKTRYMASDGRFADNIEYFYGPDGKIKYSTKMSEPDKIDLAIYDSQGRGMRQGPGVFFTADELKAKYGIDIDTSMYGTNSASTPTPKTAQTHTQATTPTQRGETLPKVITKEVSRNLTDSQRATMWRYGNAKPTDVPETIRNNVVEYLENMLGKPLKSENLIASTTDKGSYLSYFDESTNLTTTFTFDGRPNGQMLINFDAAGNPIDIAIYSIYHDGKFWLK